MAVATDADQYAANRLNRFFPGVIPELDGQCVSLVKWFMGEMSSVPDWNAARGDARYVGKNLVAQGHAREVPYAERRRGDIITYEYGQYGHIGVVLSGDRTFEENVNWPGVAAKIVDGAWVYASRIGSLNEGWRHDQHIYRLNTYEEGGTTDMITPADLDVLRIAHSEIGGWPRGETHAGKFDQQFLGWVGAPMGTMIRAQWQAGAPFRDAQEKQTQAIKDLQAAANASNEERDAAKQALAAANAKVEEESQKAIEAGNRLRELETEKAKDQETGNSFLRWLGNLIRLNK